jgi:predicted RND superfamily exporter protein
MHADDPTWHRLPNERDLAAQYLLLYEMSLPYGLDLNNQINVDKSATRVTVAAEDITSMQIRQLADAGEAWLREHAPASMHTEGVGASVMFAHISDRNIKGMLKGTGLAFLFVSVILIVAFRSARFGVLSLIPNLVPAIVAFGVWALVVGRVNIALSVVAAMTFGIVVDDTVHFLSKYLRARRERGLSPDDAVRYAFSNVGRALIATTIILAAGFAILSFSAFDLNAGMGRLTAVTIVIALAADFFFLPPLLLRIEAGARRSVTEPTTLNGENNELQPVAG